MNSPWWMRVNVTEHLANTSRLSAAEHGAYVRLLLSYWQLGPPRDDDAVLARITGTTSAEWKKVRPAIQDFFNMADGLWKCQQLEAEKAEAFQHIEKASNRTKAAREAKSKSESERCF